MADIKQAPKIAWAWKRVTEMKSLYLWRKSMGFWRSISGGIIWRVTRSHARHKFSHSSMVGMFPESALWREEPAKDGVRDNGGNTTMGRSRTWIVYRPHLEVTEMTDLSDPTENASR